MIDWLKDHKFSLIICSVLFFLLTYSLLSNFVNEEEGLVEEEWMLTDEAGDLENKDAEIEHEEPVVMLADIKGAVASPGVYQVVEGERIIHLIEKAGGLTSEADSSAVNFAMKVSDEMAVYIPKKGEENPIVNGVGSSLSGGGNESKVNLNTAVASELETLPGIGPAKSSAIIEFRETNGPFKEMAELKSITGIGDKTYDKLKENITVK